MEYINKVELQGVIGKIKETVSNYKVHTFNILVNYIHPSDNGEVLVESTWIVVKAHDKIIEGTLECGKFAHIIGRLRKETYIDFSNKECSMYSILANSIKVFND